MTDYGNNPFPLCEENDYESRCCDVCNTYVVKARIVLLNKSDIINEGDKLVIFYAKHSDEPKKTITEYGKFLTGTVMQILTVNGGHIYHGSWGTFPLDTRTDNFIKQ